MNKPPIGLVPKRVHEDKRIIDILDAMFRYAKIDKPIPLEWVTELTELVCPESKEDS